MRAYENIKQILVNSKRDLKFQVTVVLKEKEIYFSNQDCVIKDNRFLKFPKTKERLNIGKLGFTEEKLKQVRILPKYGPLIRC